MCIGKENATHEQFDLREISIDARLAHTRQSSTEVVTTEYGQTLHTSYIKRTKSRKFTPKMIR